MFSHFYKPLPFRCVVRFFASAFQENSEVQLRVPSLRKSSSTEERELYKLAKSKDYKNAFNYFSDLKEQKFKFSPDGLKLGVDLSVKTGNPISFNELCGYLQDLSISAEPTLLSALISDSIVKQDTVYLLEMLDGILSKGFPLRRVTFAATVEYLLTNTKNYQTIDNLIDRYLSFNPSHMDKLLNVLSVALGNDGDNLLLKETFKKTLLHYHKHQLPIHNSEVFDQLITTLANLNTTEKLTPINGICTVCGSKLREQEMTDEEYDTLFSEVSRIFNNQYLRFQRTQQMQDELNTFEKIFLSFSQSISETEKMVLFVDGMNASFISQKGCKIDVLRSRIIQVKQDLSISSAFIVIRRSVLKIPSNQENWKLLEDQNSLFTTRFDSRDDLFALYGALLMRQRGYLLTNDHLRELKNDIPISLHHLLDKWYFKHVINFQINPFRFNRSKDLTLQAVEYREDGTIHIPLNQSELWCCSKLN